MVSMKNALLTVVGLLLALETEAPLAEMVPVVSVENPIVSLSKHQLANIFLGTNQRFPDGSPVIPIDQAENSPVRDQFYRDFTGKSPAQVKAHWSKMIFTGRGFPPETVANGEAVIRKLQNNRNAIGYIERQLVNESVKIVKVDE